MKRLLYAVSIFIAFLFLIGCDSNTPNTILISENELTAYVGVRTDLSIELYSLRIEDLSYRMEPERIISDFDFHSFLPIEEGETLLTVYVTEDPSISDSIRILVKERALDFSVDRIEITVNDEIDIPLTCKNVDLNSVFYRVNENGFVEIDGGLLKALKAGEIVLSVYFSSDERVTDSVTVVIEDIKTIFFTQEQLQIKTNESLSLPLELSNLTEADLIYEYSEEGIIQILNGMIIPKKSGILTLSAVYRNNETIRASIQILVQDAYTPSDAGYWIEQAKEKYNPSAIIFSHAEIAEYNQNIFDSFSKTKTVDLLNQPSLFTSVYVRNLIEYYQNINKYPVYDQNGVLTQVEKDAILNNRALAEIPTTIHPKFGIVTNFAALRSYPTLDYSNNYSKDMFQETGVNVGEGVIIYHTSQDGNWYFVQTYNYSGWIEAKNVGICSEAEMKSFLDSEQFLVITADNINIDGVIVRMGQALPYSEKTETTYTLLFPTRNMQGNLVLKETIIPSSLDVSEGYLDYTMEDIFIQGFKMLGIMYSWGDKVVNGRDCSSTQNAVFACFGFKMPRNTSNQNSIPGYSEKVSSLSEMQLQSYRPGSLIFSSGHVLMYIGEDKNGNSYVFHNTSSGGGGCRIQTFKTYGSTIIATLKLYR